MVTEGQGDVMAQPAGRRSRGHGFDSWSCRGCVTTLGKLSTLFAKQYNLVAANGR